LQRVATTDRAKTSISIVSAQHNVTCYSCCVFRTVPPPAWYGVYNKHPYLDEMRLALDKWAEHLAGVQNSGS